jgi:hypothetical protein
MRRERRERTIETGKRKEKKVFKERREGRGRYGISWTLGYREGENSEEMER